MTTNATPRKRIHAIDITRGLLMVIIIVAHANDSHGGNAVDHAVDRAIDPLLRIGTPGFTLVSGLLLGYFAVARADLRPILAKYARRGVTLLLTTHLVIAAAVYFPKWGDSEVTFLSVLWRNWYITDTLAVIFVFIAPALVRLRPATRLAVALVILTISHLVYWGVFPDSDSLLVIKELVTGVVGDRRHVLFGTYPLAPLTAMFFIGSVVGHYYALAVQHDRMMEFSRRLLRLVVPLVAASGVLVAVWVAVKVHLWGVHSEYLREVFYPSRMFSTFPLYLAMFLAIFVFWVRRSDVRGKSGRVDRVFLILGKTSLFTYVVQYFVVQTAPYFLGLWRKMPPLGWLALLAVGLPLIYVAAERWNRHVKRA